MILNLDHVSFAYSDKTVIDGVNLSVREGACLGLLGPNGSGKTTLLRLMSGSLQPTRGTVLFQGSDLHRLKPRDLARQMAFIASDAVVDFPYAVREIVAMGRYVHATGFMGRFAGTSPADAAAVENALGMTHCREFADRCIGDLSSGERQRVFLARALAQNPRLLLLDEPSAHLDLKHQVEIFNLLRELQRERGITVIVVLHDLRAAKFLCSEIVLLKNGLIVNQGSPDAVLTDDAIERVFEATPF